MKRIFIGWLLWTLLCWSIIGFLMAPLIPGGWLALLAIAALLALPLRILVRGFGGGAYPSALTRLWLMRPFWYTQLLVPLLAIAGLLGMIVGLPFGEPMLAGRWLLGILASVALLVFLAGYIGARSLRVKELEARYVDLPEGLDGLRIVQLSDLHIGPHIPRAALRRVVAATNEATPDLIVFTGDQVDDFARDTEPFAAAFGSLRAPLGVYAIAGNHDIYAGWGEVRRGLEQIGMTVLVNDTIVLQRNGASFRLAGTGDPAATSWNRGDAREAIPDLDKTFDGVPPADFIIALAHNPVLWPGLVARGVELTLSGHTHYGQFSIPRIGWSLASPFLAHSMGNYQQEKSLLYINPGTGYWGIPFRIGALPEVTVITLRSSTTGENEIGELIMDN